MWKAASGCSEHALRSLAEELVRALRPGDWVLLEGPMGVGKSTFARMILAALKISKFAEGSPTFSIAHEYQSTKGEVIHLDCYRLKDETELEDAGVPSYFWERKAIVLSEWISQFKGFEAELLKKRNTTQQVWQILLSFDPSDESRRNIEIKQLSV